jgi:hypothetical protein
MKAWIVYWNKCYLWRVLARSEDDAQTLAAQCWGHGKTFTIVRVKPEKHP